MLSCIRNVKGDIVECGVFKGVSTIRLGFLRDSQKIKKKILAFDTFDRYPDAKGVDIAHRDYFVSEAGEYSIKVEDLYKILSEKGLVNIELVKGDIIETIDKYKDIDIALLILDVDLYEPSKRILEVFWSRISKGGILVLDNYNTFPGETKAVDEFFKDKHVHICRYLNKYFIDKI
jgi:hypothetical protein